MKRSSCLVLVLALLTFAQGGPPALTITDVPEYGYGWPALRGTTANVSPTNARVLVFIFVPDVGWYSKPTCDGRMNPIQMDGSWSVPVTTGVLDSQATRYAVYLVPADFALPCVQGAAQIPGSIEAVYLAKASVFRPNPFPKTIRFSNLDWVIKSPPAPVYPGPNFFSSSNVWVDGLGKLHLKVSRYGPSWSAAEVYSKDALGYGTYRAYVETPVSALDPNLVLGMFTWSEDGKYNNREIDIEFSRWGSASSSFNTQYVVQPYTTAGNILRFMMPADPSTVHSFRWDPGSVAFQSISGSSPAGPVIQQWTYGQSAGVPSPDDAHLHLNFYLANGVPPQNGTGGEIVIGKLEFIGGAGAAALNSQPVSLPKTANTGTMSVTADPGCSWRAETYPGWLSIVSNNSGSGNGSIVYVASDNYGTNRMGGIQLTSTNCNVAPGKQQVAVSQAGALACSYSLSGYSAVVDAMGTPFPSIGVWANGPYCPWNATSSDLWIYPQQTQGVGMGTVSVNILPSMLGGPRTGTVIIAGQTYTITQAGVSGPEILGFVPVTPCRVADTRLATGFGGAFGPPAMAGGSERDFFIPSGGCGIPPAARAYSLNITAVPWGGLSYLTAWPSGAARPLVSTLNSFDGRIVANAAIVPAGANGGIRLFVSDPSDVIVDINGYFTSAVSGYPLAFYTMAPCRVVDTRFSTMPPGFGMPTIRGGSYRSFALPSSPCNVAATAYSLNATAVPPGPLSYLTLWPAGRPMPLVSTLNAFDGSVVANAAIVPAGDNLAVNAYVSDTSDLVLDINGYFNPRAAPGALNFYPVTPCRISDTRLAPGLLGGPVMAGNSAREIPVPASACGIPSTARAYSLNFTVVPSGPLWFLTAWPAGSVQPGVSTLNSPGGRVLANAAIVPAGTNGSIAVYVSNTTHVIIDINGYFAP